MEKTCAICKNTKNKFYPGRAICNKCVLERRRSSGYKPIKKRIYIEKERDKHRKIKEQLVSDHDSICYVCHGIYSQEVFDFHHVNPKNKEYEVSKHAGNLQKALNEVKKCIMVCANCHRMIHAGRIPTELYVQNHGT